MARGTLIDLAIYLRNLSYNERAALLALMDVTERKRGKARPGYCLPRMTG